ncbi:FG-GAP-like repeat-containing protein, partial [Cellulomonas septica]
DRAPGDPGPSDDTPATARTLTGGAATATLSPEGDVDWYTVTVPAAGTYRAHVGQTSAGDPSTGPLLDPVVQVQDASGAVLGQADDGEVGEPEDVFVRVAAAGTLRVGVWNANGSAPTDSTYEVRVEQGPTAPFTPTFTAPADPTRTDVGVVATGDLTGDGKDDAVTVELGGGVYVYPGTGAGTLATPVNVPVPGISIDGHGVAVADLDGDGRKDAVATTATGFVLLKQASGALSVAGQTPVTSGGTAYRGFDIATVDWDGDGDQDVVVSTSRPSIQVFRNNGSGVFTPLAEAQSQQYLAVGDVTGDGKPDVVTTHAVHPQAADGTLAAPITLPSAGGPLVTAVAVGDVTGDGRLDVVRLNGSAVRVDAALAGGGFAPTKEYPAGGESGGDLVVGKIDGDARDDVLVSNAFDMRVSLLRGLSDGTLSAPLPSPVEQTVYDRPGQLALAHLDADGRVDAVLAEQGVIALQQTVPSATTTRGWVLATSPAPHTSGLQPRPPVQVTFARDLRTADLTEDAGYFRLLDATGSRVPATVGWNPTTRTVTVLAKSDLQPGQHYSLLVSGVHDSAGATLPAPVRVPFTVAAGGDRYTPVDPFRVVDTRDAGVPETFGQLASGERLVVSFAGLLPADATAVVMSVASTRHSSFGNVRAFPTQVDGSGPAPRVANLNVVPGVDQPNLVTVQLGPGQTVAVMPEGPTTDLILDVFGYYSPGGAAGYEPVTPVRVLDTRDGTGVPAGPVIGGRWVDLKIAGVHGVPADATAVVLNVAGTGVQGGTFVSVVPAPDLGEPWSGPSTSNLNLYPGRDQANLVTVKVGENGRVRFWVNRSATNLVADLAGYYTATGTDGLVPVEPVRVADSRSALGFSGKLRAGTPQNVKIGGTTSVPIDATAVVANLAGVHPASATHVRAFPTTVPATLPDVASINLVPGRDESNMAILTLGDSGRVTFYARSADVDMVVDVFGWFRTYR